MATKAEVIENFAKVIERDIRVGEPSSWLTSGNGKGVIFIPFPQDHADCVALLAGQKRTVCIGGQDVTGSITELATFAAQRAGW